MLLYFLINALLGLVFGSFATMVVHRLNAQENFGGRSKCPVCGYQLRVMDLIPVFSYILLKGHCRNCKTSISPVYPIIELLTCTFFVINAAFLQEDLVILGLFQLFTVFLIVISFCDIKSMYIPDKLLLYFAAFCLVFSFMIGHNFVEVMIMVIIMLVISVVLKASAEFFLNKQALGEADIKIFTISGLLLDPQNVSTFLISTGIIGLIFGIIYKRTYGETYFPFAPAICLALYSTVLWQPDLAHIFSI